jgi:hemerythrin
MILTLTRPIAYWQQEYETGHSLIDEQHQSLFEIVNTLHEAVINREDVDTLQRIMDGFARHTVDHFQQEEALMLMVHYPDYARHKQTHDLLLSKMSSLLQKLHAQHVEMTVDITQFISEWLTHHIKGEDRKMTQFLQQIQELPVSCN